MSETLWWSRDSVHYKTVFIKIRDSHYKDKTGTQPLYPYNGNPYIDKTYFFLLNQPPHLWWHVSQGDTDIDIRLHRSLDQNGLVVYVAF